jgi:hypothetical protein
MALSRSHVTASPLGWIEGGAIVYPLALTSKTQTA